MLYILENGTIRLTRGDTARLSVTIKNDIDGNPYEIAPEDKLTLSMKKSIRDEEPLLQKTITGSTAFHIEPDDTKHLAFGKYKYDVQLTTAGGDIYTIIEPSDFEIMQEVTC